MRLHTIDRPRRGPFPGMDGGPAEPSPIEAPEPGVQSDISAHERAAARGQTRDSSKVNGRQQYEPAPSNHAPHDPPPHEPPGYETRAPRSTITSLSDRVIPVFNPHELLGRHAAIDWQLADAHNGNMRPGHEVLRSTFRLPPEPRDSGLMSPQGE